MRDSQKVPGKADVRTDKSVDAETDGSSPPGLWSPQRKVSYDDQSSVARDDFHLRPAGDERGVEDVLRDMLGRTGSVPLSKSEISYIGSIVEAALVRARKSEFSSTLDGFRKAEIREENRNFFVTIFLVGKELRYDIRATGRIRGLIKTADGSVTLSNGSLIYITVENGAVFAKTISKDGFGEDLDENKVSLGVYDSERGREEEPSDREGSIASRFAQLSKGIEKFAKRDFNLAAGLIAEVVGRPRPGQDINFTKPLVFTSVGNSVFVDLHISGRKKILREDISDSAGVSKATKFLSADLIVVDDRTYKIDFKDRSLYALSIDGVSLPTAIGKKHSTSIARPRPDLARWAEENRPGVMVRVRLSPELVRALDSAVNDEGSTRTEIISDALRRHFKLEP